MNLGESLGQDSACRNLKVSGFLTVWGAVGPLLWGAEIGILLAFDIAVWLIALNRILEALHG